MNFINKLFKKDPEVRNIYHPEVKDKVEYAFTENGVKYYQYKEGHNMDQMRYYQKAIFLTEFENGIDHDNLLEYIKEISANLNKGLLGDALLKLKFLEQRVTIAKDFDIFYKVASVEYFDDNEDLSGYDRIYNKKKINDFKLSKDHGFFLTKRTRDMFSLLNISALDLKAFSKVMEEAKEIKETIDSLTFVQSYRKQSMKNTEK